MGRDRFSKGAGRVALVGILDALSLVFLYLSSISPLGQLGIMALAGLMPVAAVVSGGFPAGVFCYATTGILSLILVPNKGNALLYLLFFGAYPLVKYLNEHIKKRPIEWLCKLAFFNVTLGIAWFSMRAVLLAGLPELFAQVWVLYLVGNLVFIIYDLGLSKLIAFYVTRIEKA
ncbi:MAG: hypothetical protein RR216_00690, partial [Pseudoflavonifractor sp.]